jgi:hypothetical protein
MTRSDSEEVKHNDYHPEVLLMTNSKGNTFTGFCIGRLTAKQAH